MKIQFDNANQPGTGPGTFAQRLSRAFRDAGHGVQCHAAGADVSLVFIQPSGVPLSHKVVQRVDGIWFKPTEYQARNRNIRELYECAHAVVFQSEFDRKMIERWWGAGPRLNDQERPATVIGNGIEIAPLVHLTIPTLIQIREEYERIYVCSSNWHAQKRLASNVELFQRLRAKHPSSALIIMGDHPDVRVADPHVFYTGHVGPDVYLQVYAAADWMLHLAWADHCPNVVVEALSQGTPVACSEVGGTRELIGDGAYGKVLRDEPYDFELYDYDNPPRIDVTQVDDLPSRHELNYAGIPSIDIRDVAHQYVELFERICGM